MWYRRCSADYMASAFIDVIYLFICQYCRKCLIIIIIMYSQWLNKKKSCLRQTLLLATIVTRECNRLIRPLRLYRYAFVQTLYLYNMLDYTLAIYLSLQTFLLYYFHKKYTIHTSVQNAQHVYEEEGNNIITIFIRIV